MGYCKEYTIRTEVKGLWWFPSENIQNRSKRIWYAEPIKHQTQLLCTINKYASVWRLEVHVTEMLPEGLKLLHSVVTLLWTSCATQNTQHFAPSIMSQRREGFGHSRTTLLLDYQKSTLKYRWDSRIGHGYGEFPISLAALCDVTEVFTKRKWSAFERKRVYRAFGIS